MRIPNKQKKLEKPTSHDFKFTNTKIHKDFSKILEYINNDQPSLIYSPIANNGFSRRNSFTKLYNQTIYTPVIPNKIKDIRTFKKLGKQLGEGSFGVVYKVKMKNGSFVAGKFIVDDENHVHSVREIDIMSRLSHPYLMESIGMMRADKQSCSNLLKLKINSKDVFVILMPLGSIDVFSYINKRKKRIDLHNRLKIAYKIALGINFLHKNNILHLDIKPDNILMVNDEPKISDFGLSTFCEVGKTVLLRQKLVTVTYRPPEIWYPKIDDNGKYYEYSSASDVWSFGILFLYLVVKRKCFFKFPWSKVPTTMRESYLDKNIIKDIKKYLVPPLIRKKVIMDLLVRAKIPKNIINSVANLIFKLLDPNPSKRLSLDIFLDDPLFEKILQEIGDDNQGFPSGTQIVPRISLVKRDLVIYYRAFDYMLKLSIKLSVSIECFFLSCDIFHRLLKNYEDTEIKEIERGDVPRNIPKNHKKLFSRYTTFISACIMLASRITDEDIDPEVLIKLTTGSDRINLDILVKTTWSSMKILNGIIYKKNAFHASKSIDDLLILFKYLRNHRIYPLIDISNPYNSVKINSVNNVLTKENMSLSAFYRKTKYCGIMLKCKKDRIKDPIQHIFDMDLDMEHRKYSKNYDLSGTDSKIPGSSGADSKIPDSSGADSKIPGSDDESSDDSYDSDDSDDDYDESSDESSNENSD